MWDTVVARRPLEGQLTETVLEYVRIAAICGSVGVTVISYLYVHTGGARKLT